jgi:hypothetical protein
VLVQDCTCGEPVLDDARKCPRCDRPNPRYRHPRWRTFWPEIDTLAGADEAITLGYSGAFGAALLAAVSSFVPSLGGVHAGVIDAALFALCGVGIRQNWRSAAVLALLLLVAGFVLSGGIGVLGFFILIGLINGVRGTFLRPRMLRVPRPEVFD